MKIKRRGFGEMCEGRHVDLYTLTNDHGVEVKITNYGGIVVSLMVPDGDGELGDVVLGYDTLSEYLDDDSYFGCIIGRYANRIAHSRFKIDDVEYILSSNEGLHHLHGGIRGFNKILWEADQMIGADFVGLKLMYLSNDGEEGYPGTLSVDVTYSLTNSNELRIDYRASTDKDTVCNLSHHSYFNLAGSGTGDILSHILKINADQYTPTDENLIPTGEVKSVKNTPMDFTKPIAIGSRIEQDFEQLKYGDGYDHNWVLNKSGNSLTPAVEVYEPTSRRILEVYTTEPGIQFYTGNKLNDRKIGKRGNRSGKYHGFCLEAQHFPDSPNKPEFPSTVLKQGDIYEQKTIYRFSTFIC